MPAPPTTLTDYIETIRAGYVCSRCHRYVGSLANSEYVPPPYPVHVDGLSEQDEVQALVRFEWHMLGLLNQRKFTLAHPERDGVCVPIAEWSREDPEDEESEPTIDS